jgi:hypothetical protein
MTPAYLAFGDIEGKLDVLRIGGAAQRRCLKRNAPQMYDRVILSARLAKVL